MLPRLVVLFGTLATLLGARPAAAAPRSTLPLAKGDEVPIGVSEFPPFKYVEGDKPVGSDTEIVEQVVQRMGLVPHVFSKPWKRILEEAAQGKFAIVYLITRSPDREAEFLLSKPLSTVMDVFYKRKADKVVWKKNGYEELYRYSIGISEGYSYADPLMKAIEQQKFKAVESVIGESPELQNLRKLAKGRMDLLVCEVSVCQFLIRKYAPEFDDLDYIGRPIGKVRTFHAGFPKVWPGADQLVKQFDRELDKLVKDGTRAKILKKYGVKSELP
jgi:polar amino acid transport system substrate-binding protein